MAATKGADQLLQSMEKGEKAPRLTRGIAVVAIAAVVAIVVGVVLALRQAGGSPDLVRSPTVVVPTTVPYNPRPGPGGTKVLTEPVDILALAVPNGWQSPAPDALTLPGELDRFALQAPALAALLQAEGQVASKSGVRLFAYQSGGLNAFVSVVSFSSPGVSVPDQGAIDSIVAEAKKRTPNVAVSAVKLPVGQVLKLDSTLVSQNQHVVVEVLVLTAGGRTMEIEMVSETKLAELPSVFEQIARSIHLG